MIAAVTSWRGTGTTTTALLLAAALAEEQPSWLIEADPAGGVLAGRLDLAAHQLGGLERVAFGPDGSPERFGAVAHQLDRVRVVAAPADPFRAHACHTPRVPWLQSAADLDGDVVIDAGRCRPGAVPTAVLTAADTVVLVTSPEVAATVSSVEWRRAGGAVLPGEQGLGDTRVLFVAVDAPSGVSFDEATLAGDLGGEWGGWLPWEPDTVDLVLRGAPFHDRRVRRGALVQRVRRLAAAVRTADGQAEVVAA